MSSWLVQLSLALLLCLRSGFRVFEYLPVLIGQKRSHVTWLAYPIVMLLLYLRGGFRVFAYPPGLNGDQRKWWLTVVKRWLKGP